MRNIAGLNMLLRARVELPAGLRLATDEFCEGWNFVTGDAGRLEKRIRLRGWNLIKIVIADRSLRSGVGETSQEVIGNALVHALGRISEHFNVVEVDRIDLAEYLWFFLARVMLCPYRIQKDAVPAVLDEAPSHPIVPPQRRLPMNSPELYPHFGAMMPVLKEMLVLSRSTDGRTQ
jgi:hypothetical protein